MPSPLKFILVILALAGLFWFSNYAFHEVDKSQGESLRRENKDLKAQLETKSKEIQQIATSRSADLAKKKETLLALFPNDAERINALFSPAATADTKATDKAAEKTADKATTEAAPSK